MNREKFNIRKIALKLQAVHCIKIYKLLGTDFQKCEEDLGDPCLPGIFRVLPLEYL